MAATLRIAMLLAGAAWAQTTPPAPTGSISGSVVYQATGAPPDKAMVVIDPGNKQLETDAQGRFSQHDLAPATYHLRVYAERGRGSATRVVTLNPGQDLTVDFQLPSQGSITGRVVDENKEPVPDMSVFLVAREYQLGTLHYVIAGLASTNDKGEYSLAPVAPGRGYLVLAKKWAHNLVAVSDAPADPKLRKRIPVPTYYGDADSAEGAQIVSLRSGERREGVDIRMVRSPSYCIEGVLDGGGAPASLIFQIDDQQPTSGESGGGAVYLSPPGGVTGPDGRIRVCDLHPGDYRLMAFDQTDKVFGSTDINIADGDVRKVRCAAVPRIAVPGEVIWNGKAPEKPVDAKLSLWLTMNSLAPRLPEEPTSSIPGEFLFPGMPVNSYAVHLRGLPDDLYVKDITYSGQSILHKPLNVGRAIGKATLRIVVATDGGIITGKVTDRDGNPIPDSWVTVMPADAESEAALAAAFESEQTDQSGAWSTKRLAPGKYYVVASGAQFDMTPESIGRLWQLHTSAQEVELGPGATVQVTVAPIAGE
jgi:hypothetical protein